MTMPAYPSVTDELLGEIKREVDRNGPCAHDNHQLLGRGDWIKCEDCGSTVDIDFLGRAKESAARHDDLSSALGNVAADLSRLRAENAELAKDAGRYRWLREQESERGVSVVSISRWISAATCVAVTFADGSFVDYAIDKAMEQTK